MIDQYKKQHSSKWIAPKYDSCIHEGLINEIFDRDHCSYVKEVYDWCKTMGDHYDLLTLRKLKALSQSKITFGDNESIYQIGFYTSTIKEICEYCEIMFVVDKFDVAKCFEKQSIKHFHELEEKAIERLDKNSYDYDDEVLQNNRFYKKRIACVYAEMNDYDTALKLLEECETMCNDSHYKGEKDKLMKYVKNSGTSILSSDL